MLALGTAQSFARPALAQGPPPGSLDPSWPRGVAGLERAAAQWIITSDPSWCGAQGSATYEDPWMLLRLFGGNGPFCSPHFYFSVHSTHRRILANADVATAREVELSLVLRIDAGLDYNTGCPPLANAFEAGFALRRGAAFSEMVVQYETGGCHDLPVWRLWIGLPGGDQEKWLSLAASQRLEPGVPYEIRLMGDIDAAGGVLYREFDVRERGSDTSVISRGAGDQPSLPARRFPPVRIDDGPQFTQADVLLQLGGNEVASPWDAAVTNVSLRWRS